MFADDLVYMIAACRKCFKFFTPDVKLFALYYHLLIVAFLASFIVSKNGVRKLTIFITAIICPTSANEASLVIYDIIT